MYLLAYFNNYDLYIKTILIQLLCGYNEMDETISRRFFCNSCLVNYTNPLIEDLFLSTYRYITQDAINI